MDEEGQPEAHPTGKVTDPPPAGVERRILSKDEADIDPLHYAGENFTSTEEIPRIKDIKDRYLRGRALNEGDYWPGPRRK